MMREGEESSGQEDANHLNDAGADSDGSPSSLSSSSSSAPAAAATAAAVQLDTLQEPGILPGRVRTNSGTTCSARDHDGVGVGGEDGDDDSLTADDDGCVADADAINDSTASPTCVADALSSISTVVDVQEGLGAEVMLTLSAVRVDGMSARNDDHNADDEAISVASTSSYQGGQNLYLDAPTTPRAAQLLLENYQNGHGNDDGNGIANANASSNDFTSFIFCGVTDIVNCQKDDLTSSPLIRPANRESPSTPADAAEMPSMAALELNELDHQENAANYGSDGNNNSCHAVAPSTPSSQHGSVDHVPPPASANATPSSPMASKLGCGGNGGSPCRKSNSNINKNSNGDLQLQQQTAIEATIGNFLSSPGDWCDGWQAWSIHMSAVCDGSHSDSPAAMDQADLKTVLRNRAGCLNDRRRRIHRLRRDLSPFDIMQPGRSGVTGRTGSVASGAVRGVSVSSLSNAPGGMRTPPLVPGGVKKSRSFADASSALLPRLDDPDVASRSSVISMTSSVLEAIQNCDGDSVTPSHRRPSDPMRASNMTNTSAIGSDDDQADLCYDSDPGDAGGNSRKIRDRDLHSAPTTTAAADEANMHSVGKFLSQGGTWSYEQYDDDASIDPSNDDHVSKAVDAILHRRMMLVWHQPEGPVAVYAWIELGSQLRSALIQPKLMWKPVHETEDERGALGITTHINLHSVDLLDISRILAANKIDRRRHPLAKGTCSLSVETFDHNLLFEASCQKERDTLVKGLKGLVARLASKIIVGDERVFDEYFTPFGSVVPGEAPEWARSYE